MIEIVPCDPGWSKAFAAEAKALRRLAPAFVALEHIGSTAVPGLAAKPVIDMMAAIGRLEGASRLVPAFETRGYRVVGTGMRDQLFLQRPGVNLHVVSRDSWPRQKECLMRDALIADPIAAADYAALKRQLARAHARDMAADTRVKTAFEQSVIDRVHDCRGWPREDVCGRTDLQRARSARTDLSDGKHLSGARAICAGAVDRRGSQSCSDFRYSAIWTSRNGVGVLIPSPPS